MRVFPCFFLLQVVAYPGENMVSVYNIEKDALNEFEFDQVFDSSVTQGELQLLFVFLYVDIQLDSTPSSWCV